MEAFERLNGYLIDPQKSWNRQLQEIESAFSAGANPLYNYYAEEIIPKFSDASGRPRELELPALGERKICLDVSSKKQSETRVAVICAVDRNNLWREAPSSGIIRYVEDQLRYVDHKLCSTTGFDIKIDVTSAKGNLDDFGRVYTGVSNTMAAQCKGLLHGFKDMIADEKGRITISPFEYLWIRMVLHRLVYSNAWYGKAEARALLMALNKAKAVFGNIPSWESDDGKIYLFWLQCYARYQIAIREKAHELVDIAHGYLNTIRHAQEEYHKSCIKSYEEKLQKGTDMSLEELHQALKLF